MLAVLCIIIVIIIIIIIILFSQMKSNEKKLTWKKRLFRDVDMCELDYKATSDDNCPEMNTGIITY